MSYLSIVSLTNNLSFVVPSERGTPFFRFSFLWFQLSTVAGLIQDRLLRLEKASARCDSQFVGSYFRHQLYHF